MYSFLRKFLFLLPPECAHCLSLTLLKLAYTASRVARIQANFPKKPCSLWGLEFPNPVGLAAGLDKNAEYVDALFGLGFGFIEVGAVTPKAQSGNPKPRLFRLPKARALINRMGFNNLGVDYLVSQLKKRKVAGVLGVNLGKNKETPLSEAYSDYAACLEEVYPYADYVSVNISSPNTEGLRELQGETYLRALLSRLMKLRSHLQEQHQKFVPLTVKVAPDLTPDEIDSMARIFIETKIDGIIAVNTTRDRGSVRGLQFADQLGGLSGAPLFIKTLQVIKQFNQATQGSIPLIAVGGITSAEQVRQLLQGGASLVQLYTGLIYKGPGLIRRIVTEL